MSDTLYIEGFCAPSERWQQMGIIYMACIAAGVPIPRDVVTFFDEDGPIRPGPPVTLQENDGVTPWPLGDPQGYQIELAKLPKDLQYLIVYLG